jgi:hypothetical protein
MPNTRPLRLSASQLVAAADDNLVTLPDPSSGRLGDLIASAGGPGQSHELSWEFGARTAFTTESLAWSNGRRRLRSSPAVVAVIAVTSLLVTTTGLAAATGLPGPAARVVDHVLRHIDLTIQPPEVASAVAQSPLSGTSNPTSATSRSTGRVRTGNTVSCSPISLQFNHGPACAMPVAQTNSRGRGGTAAASEKASDGGKTTRSVSIEGQKTGRSSSATNIGGSLGGAIGSNHGTGRGGAGHGGSGGQSTGSGQGTGSNRGGNKGTGSNRGGNKGTGSNRGGNKGTGSNRGGNKGTGTGHHHHRGSHHGTAIPDPGTPSSAGDSGAG